MTNYEKLREWSIDDWVDSRLLTCKDCVFENVCTDNSDCNEGVRRWLESEVEEAPDIEKKIKEGYKNDK